ncbi:MAG: hypothetical protein WEB00_13630 [Dehalococcoidia bacterium]
MIPEIKPLVDFMGKIEPAQVAEAVATLASDESLSGQVMICLPDGNRVLELPNPLG